MFRRYITRKRYTSEHADAAVLMMLRDALTLGQNDLAAQIAALALDPSADGFPTNKVWNVWYLFCRHQKSLGDYDFKSARAALSRAKREAKQRQ